MEITKSQLNEIINSLPDFESYPNERFSLVLLDKPKLLAQKHVCPNSLIPTRELTFVKNYRLNDWTVDLPI